MRDAGVVYKAIQPAAVAAKLVKNFLHLAVIRYVALDSIRLTAGGADLLDRVVGGLNVNLENIDKRTLLGQGEGDRFANARSRAGHDSRLFWKAEHARQSQRDRPAWQVPTHP